MSGLGRSPLAHECRQRQRAHTEDQIRNDKGTACANLSLREFEHNRVWLMLVPIAHDLLCWTQRLLLSGELARCEPKRLLHVAARLSFHARKATLRIHNSWPWAHALTNAFGAFKVLPMPHQQPRNHDRAPHELVSCPYCTL